MTDLLTKLKLKKELYIELDYNISDFIEFLKEKTESSDLSFMKEYFDALFFYRKKSTKPFKGIISSNSFKLRQNKSLSSTATSNGKWDQKNGILAVKIEIKGIDYRIIPVCIFSLLMFILSIAQLNIGNSEKAYILQSIEFLGFGLLPYLKMRWDTKQMTKIIKNEFESIKG